MKDSDLKTMADYNGIQIMAANRVLIELVNLFDEYKDNLRIIGGWVPELMFPETGHIGSIDVDVLLNHKKLKDAVYMTMERILLKNGYKKHPEKFFSFIKPVKINETLYDVDVDILAGMYNGTGKEKNSQRLQGVKALKATGGDYAFKFPPQNIEIEGERPDGAIDRATVNVVAVVPFIIMKTAAMGRGKAKDAYDIYFIIKHYSGGVVSLAEEFKSVNQHKIVIEMKEKLSGKFASINHVGPKDVSDFLDVHNEEAEIVKRDAYEQVTALLKLF